MKKLVVSLILMFLVSYNTPAYSQTINEADTKLCDTLKYPLIKIA
jgi:hypothetical protein